MEANFQLNAKTYTQVMVNAWLDKDFKDRLLEHPTEVLKEYGIDMPDSTTVRVADGQTSVEWDEGVLVLPLPPTPTDISDQGIEQAIERQCDVSVDACCCCCCA